MPPPRPELENPPEVFYNATEARRYTVNTRVRTIQREMTLRALELLNLPKADSATAAAFSNQSALLLDVGCGSGISGDVLTEQGHAWVGVDISGNMLAIAKEAELRQYAMLSVDAAAGDVAQDLRGGNTRVDTSHVKWGLISDEEDEEEEEEEDDAAAVETGRQPGPDIVEVLRGDIGEGLPFRPGSFDGCVSISAIQWLCHSSKRGEVPQRRLQKLFQTLYNSLRRGAKAVLQFYPSGPDQIHMITRAAMKCGFGGGVVVDYPHSSRAKKHYLVLQAGQVAGGFAPPPGLTGEFSEGDEEDEDGEGEFSGSEYEESDDGDEEAEDDMGEGRKRVRVAGRDRERVKRSRTFTPARKRRRKDNRPVTGTRDWVLLKKDERRRRGLNATADTKYTMRPRKPRF